MGFACGTINDGMGMGQDTSGIRSLLRPLVQRLRSNNQEEVNAFLDEIDKNKHRQDTAGLNARRMNRLLDGLRRKGSLFDGVSLGRGKGKLFAAPYDPRYMPPGMALNDSDNKIIISNIITYKFTK